MNLKEKELFSKIVNKNISIGEQRSALIFLTILFVIGWASGIVDYSNFYSDVPALIQLSIFICIILFLFLTILKAYQIAKNNLEINFISTYIILSSFIIKKLLISFSLIALVYVISYTLLKEIYDIVFYEVQYYFSCFIILLYSYIFYNKIINYFNHIYGVTNE